MDEHDRMVAGMYEARRRRHNPSRRRILIAVAILLGAFILLAAISIGMALTSDPLPPIGN